MWMDVTNLSRALENKSDMLETEANTMAHFRGVSTNHVHSFTRVCRPFHRPKARTSVWQSPAETTISETASTRIRIGEKVPVRMEGGGGAPRASGGRADTTDCNAESLDVGGETQ